MATPSLREMNIFNLKKIVSNISCKLSIITDFHPNKQIFCVVTDTNDIFLHFTNSENVDCIKLISWFRKSPRSIVDVCFDSSSSWLLILCLDNTLHVVPAMKLFEKNVITSNSSFSNNYISSYIIPFVGLHDCVCQRTNISNESFESASTRNSFTKQRLDIFKLCPECPHPVSLIWWTTIDRRNRAIVGYSDGSVCFVGLSPNCPLVAIVTIGDAAAKKLVICKDNSSETISLLITSSLNQQFKLLLEQKCIDYVFPGDISPTTPKLALENWQIVLNNKTEPNLLNSNEQPVEAESVTDNIYKVQDYEAASKSGLLPSAKATLASLRVLGTKKINAFRTKFTENRQKVEEYMADNSFKNLSIIDSPKVIPELLDSNGGIFEIQHLRHTNLLSILDSQSCTLSVHSMDTCLIPLFRYKIPNGCREILITSNILYSIEHKNDINNEFKVSVGVLSSALASVKDITNKNFNQNAVLSVFDFENESVLNILRKSSYSSNKPANKTDSFESNTPPNHANQLKFYKKPESEGKDITCKPTHVSDTPFPKINFDPCYVVTNKNLYFIDLRKEPMSLFLDSAIAGAWKQCEEFCEIFDLSFLQCMEFVGDYLLRKKLVTQALLTYNVIRIPPVRTALKLAIHRENYPLMHLCAMALKQIYILKSKYLNNNIIKSLFKHITNLHAEDITKIFEQNKLNSNVINEGKSCSNYKYGVDESSSSLQMTLASQFHISNLLLIALAEKAVRDKNYIPLWNFICTNGKFHTNMTSIVLSQSGLYSSALILAKVRGTCIDVFLGLTSVLNQEFGFYSELNVCLFNLTDPIFVECLTYLEQVSLDYFNTIQKKLPLITNAVLVRLEKQLYPFASVFRPKLFNNYSGNSTDIIGNDDLKSNPAQFSTRLIETYLAVLMQIQKLQSEKDNINNAFSSFNLTYEENKFAINSAIFPALSVGCTHCCYVADGVAYFWGSNGVPIIFNISNISEINEPVYAVKTLDILKELNLEIHAVKCGRQHTLMLTNNGLYAFGSNQVLQLGIGKAMLSAQHPVLVETLDYKNITIMEAGQYHNAVVADNRLYTWGWGVYGQLGHGDIENVSVPTIVQFFINKKILKVSLGHAHSMVLCGEINATELYVFGSNHFGQLGIGKKDSESNAVKVLQPLRLDFGENIININTKFFSNLAVNDSNELFTWGSSPQALRMANQVKRREIAKHKLSETLKKEIKKRELAEKIPPDTSDQNNTNLADNIQPEVSLEISSRNPTIVISQSEDLNNHAPNVPEIDQKKEPLNEPTDSKPNSSSTNPAPPVPLAHTDSRKFRRHQYDSTDEKHSRSSESFVHLSPTRVDTERVCGEIINLSSGLFHFALVTSENLLYTWGKNLEHQLGTEDKERKSISMPTQVEGLQNSLYVDCGSDFTVVLTTDFAIKAFGGNTNGQCGMDIKAPMDDYNQNRLFCLPATKRLMLMSAPTVGAPHEINIPSPTHTHRTAEYLKSIPKYKSKYINKMYPNSYIEEFAKNPEQIGMNDSISTDSSLQNDSRYLLNTNRNQISSDYIHYCLYIFHGLYDSEKVMEISDNRLEYKVRMLMLNVKFLDAFSLCLTDCKSAKKATKFFEYFTKDTSNVPIKRHQIKFFIYHYLNFVILNNFNIADCEAFFLSDLDYYLLELSFVIYFNNKNLDLEINLYKTFDNVFNIENKKCILFNTEVISDRLSTKFKTIVCQNVINYYNK